jgi:2-polyprenyl-3-methyl-5-hydroxy-6-metoxy-1,4-benzoquinol methylase
MIRFGAQRLVRPETSGAERWLFRLMGVADPAHYLHSLYFRRALDSLPAFQPRRILDAGCGFGDYSFYLAQRYPAAQVLGLDMDQARIERNRTVATALGLANVIFEPQDLTTLDGATNFDLVIAIDVLEHIALQEQALNRLSQALVPGGIAFIHLPTVRERPVPFSRWLTGFHAWAEKEHIAQERTAKEFTAAVGATGLEILQSQRTFGYFSGELATSLFALPYRNTPWNRALLGALAPFCRVLAWTDILQLNQPRYAVAVLAHKPRPVSSCATPATAVSHS